jgi:[acyl-carrier-protein] S-malonyltransferase
MKKDNVCYLFPGQGAQYQGMALDFLSAEPVSSLFETASEICGMDMKILLDSNAEVLKRTDISQPAITLANLAAAVFLSEQGYSPAACAGFSLGEYAALVCSGVIDSADCFRLVKARGEAMQKTADRLREETAQPGMAAVIGLSPESAVELIEKWNSCQSSGEMNKLYAANFNSPKQLTISGTAQVLNEAETYFKDAGAKKVIRLQVAGPFHSPLMADAAELYRPVLESVTFNDPSIPLFSNVTGKRILSGEEAKKLALLQITNPVRWIDVQAAILSTGIEACLEVGPGKVLQGLWKDSGSEIPCFAAGTTEDIGDII